MEFSNEEFTDQPDFYPDPNEIYSDDSLDKEDSDYSINSDNLLPNKKKYKKKYY